MAIFIVDQILEERKAGNFLAEFESIEEVESFIVFNYPGKYPIQYKNEPLVPYMQVRIANKKGVLTAETYCYYGQ